MKIPQLSVFLENRSHSLLEPLQALAAAGTDIEYMYGFFLRSSGRAAMLFRLTTPRRRSSRSRPRAWSR